MLESIKSGISESDQVDRRLFEAAENSGLEAIQVGLKQERAVPRFKVVGKEDSGLNDTVNLGISHKNIDFLDDSFLVADEGEHNMDKVMHKALETALIKLKSKRSTAAVLRIINETNQSDEEQTVNHSPTPSFFSAQQLAKILKEDYGREKRRQDSVLTEQNFNRVLGSSLTEGKLN